MFNKLVKFSGGFSKIYKPSLITPSSGEIFSNRTPTFTSSSFFKYGNITHFSTDWQVSDTPDFILITWFSLNDTVNKTSITTGDLGGGIRYARVRYRANNGVISDWSETVSFVSPWATGNNSTLISATLLEIDSTTNITLLPGTYRISLWGGGGGAAGPGYGGGSGSVYKDVLYNTTTTIPFTIGSGGQGVLESSGSGGNGGTPGGGNGGTGVSGGAGGGGYSNAIGITAAGGGGDAGADTSVGKPGGSGNGSGGISGGQSGSSGGGGGGGATGSNIYYVLDSSTTVSFTVRQDSGKFNRIEIVGIKDFPENNTPNPEQISVNAGTYLVRSSTGTVRIDPTNSKNAQVNDGGGTWDDVELTVSHGNFVLASGGNGGSNSGSYSVTFNGSGINAGNSYYSTQYSRYFGRGGSSSSDGQDGGATIEKIEDQVVPVVSIVSNIPTSYNVTAGSSANFTVSAIDTANEGSTATYQWYLSTNGGSSFSEISGANSSTLTRYNPFYYSDNEHIIKCVATVTNSAGTASADSNECVFNVTRNYDCNTSTINATATMSGGLKPSPGVFADQTNVNGDAVWYSINLGSGICEVNAATNFFGAASRFCDYTLQLGLVVTRSDGTYRHFGFESKSNTRNTYSYYELNANGGGWDPINDGNATIQIVASDLGTRCDDFSQDIGAVSDPIQVSYSYKVANFYYENRP